MRMFKLESKITDYLFVLYFPGGLPINEWQTQILQNSKVLAFLLEKSKASWFIDQDGQTR